MMAVVSESMLYPERIAPSYVSSSGYYGYVPPTCPFANYESVVVKEPCNSANEAINGTNVYSPTTTAGNNYWTIPQPNALSFHQYHNDDCDDATGKCGLAMETDEDEIPRNDESRVGVSRCQNNHCVIPEVGVAADVGASSYPSGERCETFWRLVADTGVNENTNRRGNRKRNSAGDLAYLIDDRNANFTKKSRQDGGNGNVRHGAGSSRGYGSSSLRNEQTLPLNDGSKSVDATGKVEHRDGGSESFRCHEKAGNYDSFVRTNREDSCGLAVTSGSHEFGDSYLDYEIMLMETHGCTAYHYNRYRQLDSPISAETEF